MHNSESLESIQCAGCGHTIGLDESFLSDLPEDISEELSRAAFRAFHLSCQECNAGVSCYQAYASRQTPFAAQFSTRCYGCECLISTGEDVFRDTLWVRTVVESREEYAEAGGKFVGVGIAAKNARQPVSFKDLPFRLRRKFFTAGLGNGRGTRTFAAAQDFYRTSVPRSVRSMGPRAIREYLRGKEASHIKSVKNAPGIARLSDNVLWERHSRNVKRGAANMGFGDRLRAAGTNGIDAAKSVGKRAIGDASKATLWAALTELPVSAAEGFIRVAKGKKSKEEAAKDAASNTVRAGVAGGVVAAGFIVIAAFGAGKALVAASPILVPLGVAVYGTSVYRRMGEALKDDEPLQRIPLYFHASCAECGDDLSCFESFAAEVSAFGAGQDGTD